MLKIVKIRETKSEVILKGYIVIKPANSRKKKVMYR